MTNRWVTATGAAWDDRARGAYGKLATLRLPDADEKALRFFFNDVGSVVGLKSNFGDMIQRHANITHGGAMRKVMALEGAHGEAIHVDTMRISHHPAIHDAFARLVEHDTLANIARTTAVYRRLALMIARGQDKLVTVLYRFYGPRPPGEPRREVFGELAPLIEYTPSVDRERIELATKLAAERNAARRARGAGDRAARIAAVEARILRLDVAVAKRGDDAPDELRRGLETARREREQLENEKDEVIPADVLARYERETVEHALREVTTGDVVRGGCEPVVKPLPNETRRAYAKRIKLAKAAIATWATPKIHEASALLIQASNAYRATERA